MLKKNIINSKKATLNFYPKERYGERGQLSTPSAIILGVALNAQDLQFLLNHESYRNKIMVKEYDTTTNKINEIPLIKSREAKRYYNEYKVNQKIGYFKVQ